MRHAFKKCLYDACKLLNSGSNAFHATACESPNGWSSAIRSTSFDYEVLPAAATMAAALKPGAAAIHDDVAGNLCYDWHIGDKAVVDAAFIARMLRSSLLEVLRADYIRTAFAKGLSARRVWFHHALRNALIPVVTVYGTSLIAIFGVAVQTEKIFSLPGMGSTIADSALSQDAPVVLGLAIVVIAFGAFVNLIVDLSYALIDPRIKIDAKAVH